MKISHWPPPTADNVSLSAGVVVLALAGLAPILGWAMAHEEWPVLALLLLSVAVPVVIRWPVISTFGAYVFLVPFDSVSTLSTGGTLAKYIGMLAGAVLLATGFMGRRLIRPPTPAICWALFMLWAMLSAAWAIDPRLVLSPTALSLFLVYFIAASIRVSRRELVWVTILMVLGSALAAGASVFFGVETAYDPAARGGGRRGLTLGGVAASLNMFAAGLVAPLALAMGGFIGFRSWMGKLLSVAAVGAISAAIYLTMSRGALLGVAVAGAVLLYRFRLRWQVVMAGCLLIGVAALMPSAFLNRVLAVFDKDSSGSGRTGIWEIGLEALETHGLVGGGFMSFMEVYGRTVLLNPDQGARGAHNTYLGVWVELGIVGLVIMLTAVGCQLWAAGRARGPGSRTVVTHAAEAAGYGLLVTAFFSDVLWSKFFWLPWIILAWAVQGHERPEAKTESEPPEESP